MWKQLWWFGWYNFEYYANIKSTKVVHTIGTRLVNNFLVVNKLLRNGASSYLKIQYPKRMHSNSLNATYSIVEWKHMYQKAWQVKQPLSELIWPFLLSCAVFFPFLEPFSSWFAVAASRSRITCAFLWADLRVFRILSSEDDLFFSSLIWYYYRSVGTKKGQLDSIRK